MPMKLHERVQQISTLPFVWRPTLNYPNIHSLMSSYDLTETAMEFCERMSVAHNGTVNLRKFVHVWCSLNIL
jgi:hypothetical protein